MLYSTMRITVSKTQGRVVWSSLWMQGIMSILCGSMICGFVTMLYFKFVEPTFLLDLVQMCVDTYASIPGKESAQMAEMLQELINTGMVPTATSFTITPKDVNSTNARKTISFAGKSEIYIIGNSNC